MKIFSAEEIRLWDQYTIEHEPILSIDLMERAAAKCANWLLQQYPDAVSFVILCGKGNNGGDGLAIARILMENKYPVSIYILEFGHKGTEDFQTNLARLNKLSNHDIHFIQTAKNFPHLQQGQIIIDALFGSGLNRNLEGFTADLVQHINNGGNEIISIDIPSGLFVDRSSKDAISIHADHTLSFQCYKPAFLFAENEESVGEIHILDIGLHHDYYQSVVNQFELLDDAIIHSIYKPRKKFSHKGTYGHALLVAGSYGKIGAAILSAKACLRSGVGLLTCHIPACGYNILQTSVPEAMVTTDFNSSFLTKVEDDLTKYDSIGIGPGIGTAAETKMMLPEILNSYRNPLILDADALNIMARQKDLLKLIPAGSILTPHPKEFERLFGETHTDFDRVSLALQKARELNCIIVLKGHHTFIATPDGKGFFNSTGNPGMATAGSGDVLTGILTGLLAQGYSSAATAILGVYLHGSAGDIAAKQLSNEALIAGDIIETLGAAFSSLNH
ncbi:MAG: NAD(P)H-hydrate dehydratase [Chitinophagaceae bacterium]|nr:NAD(P)H-hydrate dehydratase [Chitinophagaceae bacterium]